MAARYPLGPKRSNPSWSSSTHLNSRERHAIAQVDFELVDAFLGAGEAIIPQSASVLASTESGQASNSQILTIRTEADPCSPRSHFSHGVLCCGR